MPPQCSHHVPTISHCNILILNRDGDLQAQVMTVGEVDQAQANRARADQDPERVGRVDHQVLQEIGQVITGCEFF